MKRAAVFAMVAIVIASAWTILLAQSDSLKQNKAAKESVALPAPSDPVPVPLAPRFERADAPAPQVPQAVDRPREAALTPLQQRYIDLATKKARLMTEEQLQQAVNELDRDVDELNAWSKLEQSARTLREVIEKHPQTRAAGTARSAIRIIDQGRSMNNSDNDFKPRPDLGVPPASQPPSDQKFDRGVERRTPPFDEAPRTQVIPSREPKV